MRRLLRSFSQAVAAVTVAAAVLGMLFLAIEAFGSIVPLTIMGAGIFATAWFMFYSLLK
jgi:hypothetical protein